MVSPRPLDRHELTVAEALLTSLPLIEVPVPGILPISSYMPLRLNALFVGREKDLRALAAILKAGGTAAIGQTAAVTGLGGVGKTQLACEFVYRYGRYFAGGVFWIICSVPEAIPKEIAQAGQAIVLPTVYGDLPLGDQIGLVSEAWRSEIPRLLVFDNCESEVALDTWAPRGGGCRVLVTSRRGDWPAEMGVQTVDLEVLDRKDSIALLAKHRPDVVEDPKLDEIAATLGDLPLALHLAGSFLAKYRHVPFGQPALYLEGLRRSDLLAHRSMTVGGQGPTGQERNVALSFALSWNRLDPTDAVDAMAQAVLTRAAWFAPGEPIPRDILSLSAGVVNEERAALSFEDALTRLVELGLIRPQESGAFVLHRLLAIFVRNQTKDDTARTAVERTLLEEAQRARSEPDVNPLLLWQSQLRTVAEAAIQDSRPNADRLANEVEYQQRALRRPYRGLLPFYEQDAAYFYGRNRYIELIERTLASRPLVAIVGPSGSGKSSLVFAGVVPRLRAVDTWTIAHCRPGGDPLFNLAAALEQLLGGDRTSAFAQSDRVQHIEALFDTSPETIVQLIHSANAGVDKRNRYLLIVDQFEELFTFASDKDAPAVFIRTLAAISTGSIDFVNCLLTIRADFLGQALSYHQLADALNHGVVTLGPMTTAELVRAVVGPAESVGVAIEPDLVDEIVKEAVREPYALSLMQFTLDQLWLHQEHQRLTRSAFESIGRVSGAISRQAESFYQSLDHQGQELMRRIAPRLLSVDDYGRGLVRTAPGSEFDQAEWALVMELSRVRLVTIDAASDGSQVAVARIASAILIQWPRFGDWIAENQAFLRWRADVYSRIREWEESGRDEGGLLRGYFLAQARKLISTAPEQLSEEVRRYVDESQAAQRKFLFYRRAVWVLGILCTAAVAWIGHSVASHW
jgi:hypothetical protein